MTTGRVDDIPVAHTPPGGWRRVPPPPVLAGCTEPRVVGAPDLRGWRQVVSVEVGGVDVPDHRAIGHLQRIEQCGDRLVVTAGGIVHDMRCDGTEERGVHDVAEIDKRTPITVVAAYEDGVHVLRPVGIPVEVTRRRDGEHLRWGYVGFTARLQRIGPPDGPRDGVLRTPDERFAAIVEYPWPPSYAEVEPGLRMAYVDAGPAEADETVVLLHGEPTWGYLYRKMIPVLVDAGFRVVVPDLIGFGRSDKPVDPAAYTYSQHVAWVCTLLEHLDLRGATFFGQDWGGLIGGRVVAALEERFARAVFSNTGLPGTGPGFPGLGAQQELTPERLREVLGVDWRDTVDADDRIDPDAVHGRVVPGPYLYFPAWRVYSQQVAELWPSRVVPGWCLTTLDAGALAAYDAPFPTQEYTAGARRFPMLVPLTADDPERLRNDEAWAVLERWTTKPVLTLWGDHCPHTNMTMGAPYRERIPGARLPGVEHRVYRASHFTQEDVGAEMAADIVGFVRAFPRQPPP